MRTIIAPLKRKRRSACTLLLLLFPLFSFGQNAILQRYISEALEKNIALTQQKLSYEKSMAVLQEAKAMFFPTLSLEARYSMARGGRTFEIPTGDFLNPVFSNLNALNGLAANDPAFPAFPAYPQVSNEEVLFLRRREHETKLRLVMPIFNAAILHNHQIRQTQAEIEKVTIEIFKRTLVEEVRQGYFNYLKAREARQLFENMKALADESLRTAESLHKNQKATIDMVYAAAADVEAVELQLAEADKNEKTAQAYFNFLLNAPFGREIKTDENREVALSTISLEEAQKRALQKREELQQLNYAGAMADQKIKLDKSNYLPQLNLVTDYGFQGVDYSFGKNDDYLLGSMVLQWDLFNRPNKAKVEQARIDRHIAETRKTEMTQQIALQAVTAYYDLQAAQKSMELAKAQEESAEKAFRLVNTKFKQGQANLLEITDARTRLSNAGQQRIIARYDYEAGLATFERVIAGYQF